MKKIKIGNKAVGDGCPLYFIADIAANHDGSLERALNLIDLAAESGANAAKFQNFSADKIVSRHGLKTWEQSYLIRQNGINLFLKSIQTPALLKNGLRA
jgi:sialic acid synthase SpsE